MLNGLRPGFGLGLRQRIGAIVIVHAILIYATFVLVTRSGQLPTDRVYLPPPPARVAAMITAFEHAPPETYPDLIRAFRDDRQQVRILPALPPEGTGEADHRHAADRYRAALAGRPFRIETTGRVTMGLLDRQPYFSPTPFRVSVALPNGRAVEFVRYTTAPVGRLINRFWWFGLAVALVDLLVVFWLAAQSTDPVERLVRAVRSDDMTLLRRTGAREFLELGDAFRDMRARLHQLVEERTRIIAAVAHDFRTYLTRLELRSDYIADASQRVRAVRDLDEMRQLMDDALTFARPGPESDDGDAAIDAARELEQIVRGRRDLAEDVALDLPSGEIPKAHMLVRATPMAFRRMIANLLDNALRYGEGGVRIIVSEGGADLLICIEDDGPGVPEDRLAVLTEPFRRLETSRARHTGGIGLGLSIVQALAHRFGGQLELENRIEGGLRARLQLPRA